MRSGVEPRCGRFGSRLIGFGVNSRLRYLLGRRLLVEVCEDPVEQRPHALLVCNVPRQGRIPPFEHGLVLSAWTAEHTTDSCHTARRAGSCLRLRDGDADLDDAAKQVFGGGVTWSAQGRERFEHANSLDNNSWDERRRGARDAEEEEENVVQWRAGRKESEKSCREVRDFQNLREDLVKREKGQYGYATR